MNLSSPRVRRRLTWWSAGLGVVLAIVLIFVLLPQPKQPTTAATGKPGSAQVYTPHTVHVSRAERRAIDKILDQFIPDGVGRRSMTAAWHLAGPELKAGSTLTQWRNDVSPIPHYPVGGTTFHNWQTIDAGKNYVQFALLVHPRHGSHLGAWGFSGEVVRRGSHWVVNRIYTAATFNQEGAETGPDVTGGYASSNAPPSKPKLGRNWLFAIVYILLAMLLVTPAVLFLAFLRDRARRHRRGAQPLPPLPRSAVFAQPPNESERV
jgi:hypothetical protein